MKFLHQFHLCCHQYQQCLLCLDGDRCSRCHIEPFEEFVQAIICFFPVNLTCSSCMVIPNISWWTRMLVSINQAITCTIISLKYQSFSPHILEFFLAQIVFSPVSLPPLPVSVVNSQLSFSTSRALMMCCFI